MPHDVQVLKMMPLIKQLIKPDKYDHNYNNTALFATYVINQLYMVLTVEPFITLPQTK